MAQGLDLIGAIENAIDLRAVGHLEAEGAGAVANHIEEAHDADLLGRRGAVAQFGRIPDNVLVEGTWSGMSVSAFGKPHGAEPVGEDVAQAGEAFQQAGVVPQALRIGGLDFVHHRSKEIDCGIFGRGLGWPELTLLVEFRGRLAEAGRFEVQKRVIALGGVIDEADVGGAVEPARAERNYVAYVPDLPV